MRLTPSRQDRGDKLLPLPPAPGGAAARLDEPATLQERVSPANLRSTDSRGLLDSSSRVRSSSRAAGEASVRIVRLTQSSADAIRLLEEYYEAVHVVRRDTPRAIQKIIATRDSGVWLAYLEQAAVGCVVLRTLDSIPFAGECKRLYVQPGARGQCIAEKLLDAQEDFARSQGLRSIYLDSYADLTAAIALYRKRGYVSCERYNDNPQATVFYRKDLGPPC